MSTKPDTITTFRLPADLKAAMTTLHDREGIGTSEQIRRALQMWLTKKKVYVPRKEKR